VIVNLGLIAVNVAAEIVLIAIAHQIIVTIVDLIIILLK
jgi:hypothetical protein